MLSRGEGFKIKAGCSPFNIVFPLRLSIAFPLRVSFIQRTGLKDYYKLKSICSAIVSHIVGALHCPVLKFLLHDNCVEALKCDSQLNSTAPLYLWILTKKGNHSNES